MPSGEHAAMAGTSRINTVLAVAIRSIILGADGEIRAKHDWGIGFLNGVFA
jgi:hypothetical protein